MSENVAKFPEKLRFLFDSYRYKIAYGGRGSAKSWSLARALLILGAHKRLRILCAREIQNSIKDSVHQLLKTQIEHLGLSGYYRVLDTEIRGINGTEFVFSGLSNMTVDSIKSFEGFDICWVEEAQVITNNSWNILIPTIRKDGSEIWISFNPDMDTDPTYKRFVTNTPPDSMAVEMNWRDNPFFNEVMDRERKHCQETDPDGYENIWEGKCKPAVDGAIYFKEIQAITSEKRICNIPYDPMLKVHVVFDLGWDDSLSIGLVQRHLSEVRILQYLEYKKTRLDIVSAELKSLKYNWGKVWLPHDGFAGSLNSGGKSTFDILKALGWDVVPKEQVVIVSDVAEGIRRTRMVFPRCYFNRAGTAAEENPLPPEGQTVLTNRLIECLKRYKRKISKETHTETTIVHDDYSHGADMFRYLAINADKMLNENDRKFTPINVGYTPLDSAVGY